MSKAFDVHHEAAKTAHTSHWDWDYMDAAQYDALMRADRDRAARAARRRRRRRVTLAAAVAAGAVAVAGVLLAVG